MTCRSLSILVTGAAGYIGSALVRELLAQGHRVTAVDSMLFGDRALTELAHHPRLQILRMDIRGLRREHLTGMQALIDLAGLSSDPVSELDPSWNGLAHHHAQVGPPHVRIVAASIEPEEGQCFQGAFALRC